jgi:hypothetical protein
MIIRSVRTDESPFRWINALDGGVVPDIFGDYRLMYSYDQRAHFDFKIVKPMLEAFTTQTLANELWIHENGTAEEITHRVHALVLDVGEERLILRTLGKFRPQKPQTPVGSEWLESDGSTFGPFQRVADINGPVTNLEFSTNASGMIWLRRADGSGPLHF